MRTKALTRLLLLGLVLGLSSATSAQTARDILSAFTDPSGKLRRAAQKGDVENVKNLLAKGADPNAQTSTGETALFFAAWKGHREVAALLVEAGAGTDAQDGLGRTALAVAANFNRTEVVGELLKHGADPNLPDKEGWTPLMKAVEKGSAEMVRLLLDAGATLAARNQEGKRAVDYARSESETTRLLTEAQQRLDAEAAARSAARATTRETRPGQPVGQPQARTEYLVTGDRIRSRERCPNTLSAFGFVGTDRAFSVSIDVTEVERLTDLDQFVEVLEAAIAFVKDACRGTAHMLPRIELSLYSDAFREAQTAAAKATYRQGMQVQAETGLAETWHFENYVYAETTRNAFLSQHSVDSMPSPSEMIANPFLLEGRAIAIALSFVTMETASTARLSTNAGDVLVTGVPSGRFTKVGERVLLAGRVSGKLDAPGGGGRLASMVYLGAHTCLLQGCADVLARASEAR